MPSCISGYLRPTSSVHICADGIVRSCSTNIQVGPVPRLNQTDEVSTFPLGVEKIKHNRITDLLSYFFIWLWKCNGKNIQLHKTMPRLFFCFVFLLKTSLPDLKPSITFFLAWLTFCCSGPCPKASHQTTLLEWKRFQTSYKWVVEAQKIGTSGMRRIFAEGIEVKHNSNLVNEKHFG